LEPVFKANLVSTTLPLDSTKSYRMSFKKVGEEGRGIPYYINPYTAEVLGDEESALDDFFFIMFKLHRWLLLGDEIGRMIVGISTLIFVLLCFSGLYLWFPLKLRYWRQGLKIKFNANWKRVNHDLHNTLGFYALIPLLVMALTGLCWSFGWYKAGLSVVMQAEVFKGKKEKDLESNFDFKNKKQISFDEALVIANKLYPYDADVSVRLPKDSVGVFSITKIKTGFATLASSDKVVLDQYSGAILKQDEFSKKPLNEKIVSLIKPLHTGEFMGTFSKILYFIFCLIATSLPITGVLIWINKLKKSK
ncbi:MAG: PepSY domain-containing protein, partial [Sphingobacteriaceae bacterium]|nr:PepSY domain-containing protein [Sphingobacteriaceae bacterium]